MPHLMLMYGILHLSSLHNIEQMFMCLCVSPLIDLFYFSVILYIACVLTYMSYIFMYHIYIHMDYTLYKKHSTFVITAVILHTLHPKQI